MEREYAILGNAATMRCQIPSFVADFVTVQSWIDSAEATYFPSTDYGNSVLMPGLCAQLSLRSSRRTRTRSTS